MSEEINLNAEAEGLFDLFEATDEPATESVADGLEDVSTKEPADTTQETSEEPQDNPEQEQAPVDKETPGKPSNDETRYEFWQNKYVELKQRVDSGTASQQELEDYKPIAQYLANNPEMLIKLKQELEGQPSKEAPFEPPAMPTKPQNFSLYEAHSDPESDSAKYETALSEYNATMVNILAQRDAERERKQTELFEQQKQREEQQRQMEYYKTALVEAGLNPTEFDEFNKVMNSPASLDPKNLLLYWNAMKGIQSGGKTAEQIAMEEFEAQKQRISNNPPPAGSVSGEPNKTLDDAELFNQSLLNYRR